MTPSVTKETESDFFIVTSWEMSGLVVYPKISTIADIGTRTIRKNKEKQMMK
jgi:hypothetical protein